MSSIERLPWRDYLTFAAAMVGAVLGIMNTWNAISQRQVRLKVRPLFTLATKTGRRGFAIEVINLSIFAVTIGEVGFSLGSGKIHNSPRATIAYPTFIDGKGWPRRLEPRETVTAHFNLEDMAEHRGKTLGEAYASTECGETRYGSTPALDQLREELRK